MDKLRRTQLLIFLSSGIIIFVIAFFLSCGREPPGYQTNFLIPLFVSIGSVLAGVAIVDSVWDFLVRKDNVVDEAHKMGVVELWQARIENTGEHRKEYEKCIPKSKQIDLMGLNLATEIFNVDSVRIKIAEAINTNKSVRILISVPDIASEQTRRRLREPGEEGGEEFQELLSDAQKGMGDICEQLDKPYEFLVKNIRFADKSTIYCMVLRFDDRMYVSNYLLSVKGNETPGMQIRRITDGGLFDKYLREFDKAWEQGRGLNEDEKRQIFEEKRDKIS